MPLNLKGMYAIPTDPKKIRARIRSYERKLRKELEGGYCSDGAGKRHFLGPLYLLMGDLEGALASYEWFQKTFPEDSGDEGQYLCWALALHRGGREEEATTKLRQAMLMNRYVLPRLFGNLLAQPDVEDGAFFEWMHCDSIPEPYFAHWQANERQWASEKYHGEALSVVRARSQEIDRLLKHEARGEKRTRLVRELYALRR